MHFRKLPEMLDLGEYGTSRRQVSPHTDGYAYYGLGNQQDNNQRGIQISGVFYLVHITVPAASPRFYRIKNDDGKAHMKHFHISLAQPGADIRDNHHFHYESTGGEAVPVKKITFEGRDGRRATGLSDWESRCLDSRAVGANDVQRQRARRWNIMQLDLLAKAFLATVHPA